MQETHGQFARLAEIQTFFAAVLPRFNEHAERHSFLCANRPDAEFPFPPEDWTGELQL